MTKLWHCPPSVFEQQPEDMILLHAKIYEEEIKAETVRARRESQQNKFK
jgi:hypothetical protein